LIRAAIIHHQPLDFVYARQGARQVAQGKGQSLGLVIAGGFG
jgi:hypothetical protein